MYIKIFLYRLSLLINSIFLKKNRIYYNYFKNFLNEDLILSKCLCHNSNDIDLTFKDRFGVNFLTVICKSCGLIRSKYYWNKDKVKEFYSNDYWKYDLGSSEPAESKHVNLSDIKREYDHLDKRTQAEDWPIIENYIDRKIDKEFIIVDIGGGCGGKLQKYSNTAKCYLIDYHESYLNYAKTKNINTFLGGQEILSIKKLEPDLIILSHVVEHWNDFENEMNNLIKNCKKNTYVYIKFPGVDSLKTGRRIYDFTQDIHIPHYFYFTSYVFNIIMERNGFKCVFSNSNVKALYFYTGANSKLVNNYKKVLNDLFIAEIKKYLYIPKKMIKKLIQIYVSLTKL